MKKNVGGLDKNIRIGLAIIIFAAGLYFQSWWGLIGFGPLLTGLFSFCPLYAILGINSCKVKSTKS
ncbi:MAG: DUF2892 domain-containing protein [Ignavibacteriales bacterium]|nr:DUF2892 domain-containing protein [Ignavibacteriales bacterium]